MISKLLITPWFGQLPEWWPEYEQNARRLAEHGFEWLIVTDLELFQRRVKSTLGIDCPIQPGTGKVHDYRATFGELFADEIKGYDFWGHTDFDCVYGRVEKFVTDDFLAGLDLHSDAPHYVCGPWSLYRNTPVVNRLFRDEPLWREILENPRTTGWVETAFSQIVDLAHEAGEIRREYTLWHAYEASSLARLRFDGDWLMDGDREVMMAHFRRTKRWPL